MDAIRAWLQQLQLDSVWSTLTIVLAALCCIIFHETSHGRVALWLGDRTAKDQGRLSWNPIKHIDIFGLIMMAVFKFGWAKPVPVDPRNFKKPKQGMALTSLAGPVSNVLLAWLALLIRSVLIWFYIQNLSPVLDWCITFIEDVAILSVGLAIFNIIPIPPLDGSKILGAFLPDWAYYTLMRYERWGMLVLLAVLWTGVLNTPLNFLRSGLLNGLSAAAWFPFEILTKLAG